MLKTVSILIALSLAACAADAPPDVPSDVYSVTWSEGRSDSPGVTAPVACTDVISHPCPLRLYTTKLVADATTRWISWEDATGGVAENGVRAEDEQPIQDVDALTASDYLYVDYGGDDGGFREPATLSKRADGRGWSGDMTWALFNVAGKTTFHVEIAQ